MNRQIRCMIIDDEPWAIDLLKSYVAQMSNMELVHSTTRPLLALDMILQTEVDLIYLDIQMPELNGIQMMQAIGNKCKVVITSAYSEYALAGYEHNILDYLLKPISFERFYKSVQKYIDLFQHVPAEETQQQDFLFVKTDSRFIKINYHDILFIEGARDYIFIQTETEKIIMLDSLRNLSQVLPAHDFMRIHKSYIISVNRIEMVEKSKIKIDRYWLPVGDSYKASLYKKLNIA